MTNTLLTGAGSEDPRAGVPSAGCFPPPVLTACDKWALNCIDGVGQTLKKLS